MPFTSTRRPSSDRGVALRLLFICTGNICRSPIAERLAAAYGAQLQIRDLQTASAGTHAVVGYPIQSDAASVLEQLGGDSSNFAARRLTPRIASDADLILTMTRAHLHAVLKLAPRQLNKTFTLSGAAKLVSEFQARTVNDLAALRPQLRTSGLLDIPDPMGRAADFHAMIGSQIAELLLPILSLCQSDSGD
ncbi:arsenate reductase/protein-tyrosine-phosphatase family protein [Mycolicibacterium elephantis]